MIAVDPHQLAKAALIESTQGQELVIDIPKYVALFNWRYKVNANYAKVKPVLDAWYSSWIDDPIVLKGVVKADFANCGSWLYPDANEEKLLALSRWMAWVFLWDDQIDCGHLRDDTDGTAKLRTETLAALYHLLGKQSTILAPPSLRAVNKPFDPICLSIRIGSDPLVRTRILNELVRYVDSVADVQWERRYAIPTVAEYLASRVATVGVGPMISMIEYAWETVLPEVIFDHEAAVGQVDNVVAIIIHEQRVSVQSAVDIAFEMTVAGLQALDEAEKRLPYGMYGDQVDKDLKTLIGGLKDIATGHLGWSLETPRYFGAKIGRGVRREGEGATEKLICAI